MKYYSLSHSGMFANLKVATHETEEGAKAWLATRKDVAGEVVGSESDLKMTFGGPGLVALYNALKPDDAAPVERFTSKGDGARRAFVALEARYQNQAVEAAAPSTVESTSAANNEEEGADMASKKTKKPKTKGPKRVRVAGPKEKKERKTRGESVLTVVDQMVSRKNGATKVEIIAAVQAKFPDRKATAIDNTVRGTLSIMGRTKGADKVTKTKDEKRGNVYSKA